MSRSIASRRSRLLSSIAAAAVGIAAAAVGIAAAVVGAPATALAQNAAAGGTPAGGAAARLPADLPALPSSPAGLALLGGGVLAGGLFCFLMHRRSRAGLRVYRSVLESLPHPRQIVDRRGRVIFANPAHRDFFAGREGTAAALLAEITDDEDAREQLERLSSKAANGSSGHAELQIRTPRKPPGPDGEEAVTKWVYVVAHPVRERPGAVFWMVDDITLRRQMEEVIRSEQESFADLLQNAPIGFYSVDAEGRFLFANEILGEWLGIRPIDLTGGAHRLHDILAEPPETGGGAHDPFGTGASGAGTLRLRGPDGMPFDAHLTQEVVGELGGMPEAAGALRTRSVVRNLTRELAMAEALERSERQFERFFEEAPVGIALLDEDGTITESNGAVRDLLQVKSRLRPGLSLLDLVSEQDRPAVRQGLQAAASANGLDSGGAGLPIEVHLGRKAETVSALFIARMTGTRVTGAPMIGSGPVEGEEAAPGGGFVVHFIDVTEQKALEAQFTQSQKMQAVGQLAGGIAHDFNNLLTAMIGFSDLLLLRHRPGDQSFADVMQIKQNANRAANLVRQLLAFSRQQTLQPKVLNVTDILAELTHLLRRLIGESIELKLVHGRDLGAVKADQGQLEQVIINLAVNARDAMAEGGQLTITTANVPIERDVKHKGEVMPAGDYVRIEVADTGCGIREDLLDRIFEPFFSTKEVGAGTGLGLSTVYGIVKQTGGFVFVKSREGRGTNFSIFLPHHLAAKGEAPPLGAGGEESRDLTGIGTVLLVEDEDGVRAFSARALRNKGYDVLEARSGDAALEVLNENQKPIDLLITDVVMPKLDGPTLVREVRETRPDLKVIFISGYTEDTFRKRLGEEAGIHFLPKPFSLRQLAGKVKEVMREQSA